MRVSFDTFVRPSIRINSAFTEPICVKFVIGDFYENLSTKSILSKNRREISGILHEDVSSSIL